MEFGHNKAWELIGAWFNRASVWQQDLFYQLWNGANDEQALFNRAIKLIEYEHGFSSFKVTPHTELPEKNDLFAGESANIFLQSLSEVRGVGAILATQPLNFCRQLTVVYGENGCGKSSYVKILKSAGNPESKVSILGNIFEKKNVQPQAAITFDYDGNTHAYNWTLNSSQAYPIQIYDTATAKQFVEKENEILYEPKILSLITRMTELYVKINDHYDTKESLKRAELKSPPEELSATMCVKEYNNLSSEDGIISFQSNNSWSPEKFAELELLKRSLQETNPQKKVDSLVAHKKIVIQHQNRLALLFQTFSDSSCSEYIDKRKKQIETKKLADEYIMRMHNMSILSGFGQELWKSLWEAAKNYSAQAYPDNTFPAIDDARCLLCQQPLDRETSSRLESFHEVASSNLINEMENAKKEFEAAVGKVQQLRYNELNIDKIRSEFVASTIPDEIQNVYCEFYTALANRAQWLLDLGLIADQDNTLPAIPEMSKVSLTIKAITDKLDSEVSIYSKIDTNRPEQEGKMLHLQAEQWIDSNKNNFAIKIAIMKYEKIRRRCKTNTLTTLKKELTELLITDVYIARFQEEMGKLDINNRIRVELVSRGAKQGRAYHQVSLKGVVAEGNIKSAGDILSEGEFRVVSLAAFLADLSSWEKIQPFVFDDPITSLDCKYESKVAERLVQLSLERQVIVFTHRLTFANLLEHSIKQVNDTLTDKNYSQQASVTFIELRNSPLGQPMEPSFKVGKLDREANNMKCRDLAQLRKLWESENYTLYEESLRSLCSRIRILIESGIETNLLSGVVTRYGHNISTQKLRYLHCVNKDDIGLFEEFMTRYSFHAHSQPLEKPISLPDLADVEKDLKRLIEWVKNFEKRKNSGKS